MANDYSSRRFDRMREHWPYMCISNVTMNLETVMEHCKFMVEDFQHNEPPCPFDVTLIEYSQSMLKKFAHPTWCNDMVIDKLADNRFEVKFSWAMIGMEPTLMSRMVDEAYSVFDWSAADVIDTIPESYTKQIDWQNGSRPRSCCKRLFGEIH